MLWIVNKSIAGTWRCSKCGRLAPDPGYMYCPHCGEMTDEPHDARQISEKWTPVADGLPKNTTTPDGEHKRYLVSFRKNGKIEVHIAFFVDGGWFWHIGNPCDYEITAWAPLPEAYKTWADIKEENND